MTGAVTRRDVLRVGGVAVTVAVTGSACSFLSTKPSGSDADTGTAKKTKEPPTLAAKVRAGKLPPVKDRLPAKPLVVRPAEKIGRYGGAWHLRIKGEAYGDAATIYSYAGYENLVRWDPTFKKVVPDIATSYQVNADSTEYTFVLREGMRWSDGKPFGPDDVVFAVQDILMDKRITSIPPFGDMKAAKVDDHTVKVTFTKSNGTFVNYLATRRGAALTDYPRHYLEKFHPKYNPQHAAEAKKIGFKDGITVLQDVGGTWSFGRNPDKPTLYAWVLTTSSDQKSQVVVERNPYYWKVDPEGSQLPYIDRIVYSVIGDDEAALLKTLNGEIDVSTPQLKDKPVVAKYRERGDFRLFDVVPEAMNVACIYPNLTHEDPVKREIFNNRNFRVGLSHAINRPEIIKAVFQRQGEPWQVAPRKESTYLRQGDGPSSTPSTTWPRRTRSWTRSTRRRTPGSTPRAGRQAHLVPRRRGHHRAHVGGRAGAGGELLAEGRHRRPRQLRQPGDRGRTRPANKHDFSVWAGEGGLDGVVLLNPYNYLPLLNPYSFFGVKWADWYNTKGKTGERPPADVRRQMTLYDR